MDNFYSKYSGLGGGGGVTSLNGLTGALTLVGAGGITVTPSGTTITIDGSGFANTALSNLTFPTAINQDLSPAADGGENLGNNTHSWGLAFIQVLADGSNVPSVLPYARTLHSSSNKIVLNWGTQSLNDSSAVQSVDWNGRQLIDSSSIPGVDWQARNLLDSSGSLMLNWDGAIDVNNNPVVNVPDPINPLDAANKEYVDANAGVNNKELFTLSPTNITNQYIDLAHIAKTNSIDFLVKGGGIQIEGASYDYSVNYTGGSGGNTRITFLNGLATGGISALVSGDVLVAKYEY